MGWEKKLGAGKEGSNGSPWGQFATSHDAVTTPFSPAHPADSALDRSRGGCAANRVARPSPRPSGPWWDRNLKRMRMGGVRASCALCVLFLALVVVHQAQEVHALKKSEIRRLILSYVGGVQGLTKDWRVRYVLYFDFVMLILGRSASSIAPLSVCARASKHVCALISKLFARARSY